MTADGIVKILGEHFPLVGEGEIIPEGVSFKHLRHRTDPRIRLYIVKDSKRIAIDIDEETRVSQITSLLKYSNPEGAW